MDFPAESGRLALARHALRDWLARCDMPRRVAQDVLIAAGEACADAIEHGHRDTPGGDVRLAAEASTDTVRVTVADAGRWKPRDPASTLHRRAADGRAVLGIEGEMDMSNSELLAEALEAESGPLLVDLTGVEYRIELVAPPLLHPVLTISGLTRLVKLHPSQ
ncbi:ATP-binding protein [Streptomyces sp. NPDC006476]|uniref:ATP-binding protein n=1 Tax=Streptomyces sp. NPDC006476 TaxID=3157175 RepID=UPI0033A25C99